VTVRDRDQEILGERIGGATLQAIGERHSVSIEGARQIVLREGRRQIYAFEQRLRSNRKTNDLELFVVPFQAQADWQLALRHFDWCCDELRKRGVDVKVHSRPATEGLVLALEDVTCTEEDDR